MKATTLFRAPPYFIDLSAFPIYHHRQCVIRRSRCWRGSDNVRPLDLITVRSRNGTKKSRNQSWCLPWWVMMMMMMMMIGVVFCGCTVTVLCGEHGRCLKGAWTYDVCTRSQKVDKVREVEWILQRTSVVKCIQGGEGPKNVADIMSTCPLMRPK